MKTLKHLALAALAVAGLLLPLASTRPQPASSQACGTPDPLDVSGSTPDQHNYLYVMLCAPAGHVDVYAGYDAKTNLAHEDIKSDIGDAQASAVWNCSDDPWIATIPPACTLQLGSRYSPPDFWLLDTLSGPYSATYLNTDAHHYLAVRLRAEISKHQPASEYVTLNGPSSAAYILNAGQVPGESASLTDPLCVVCPVVTPTSNSNFTVANTCAPSFTGASPAALKVTDCTLVFTAHGGLPFVNGTLLLGLNITADNAAFTGVDGATTTTTGCENGVGGGGVLSSYIYTCVVGPIIVTGPTTLCATILFSYSAKIDNVCPVKALAGESTTTTLAGSGAAAYLSSGTAPLPPTPTTTPAPTHASIASAPAIAPWPQLPSSSPQIEAVTSLQYLLQQCVAPTLSVDGKFGPETDAAVRAFQKAQGLPDDGKVGAATWLALIVPPMPVQQNMPMCMPMPPGMSMPPMQQGSTGPAVKAVQSQLNTPSRLSARAGVALTVDGVFGPSGGPTDTAVKAYQKGQGLPANGQVGADTWQALLAGS